MSIGALLLALGGGWGAASLPDTVPASPPVGRAAVDALQFPELVFDPPFVEEREISGVPIYHLHDPTLPLVDIHVQVRGGTGNLPREDLAAATGLPSLLRNGGTATLPPDSVNRRIDLLALQLSVGGGGGSTFASLNSLTHTLDEGLELFGEMLADPGFDAEAVDVWLGQERERVRRREDDPGSLAFSEFNRLLFGDHPVGWVLTEEELDPERVTRDELLRVHSTLYCRGHLIVGVSGDLDWESAEPLLARFLERWPECGEPLPDVPAPDLRREGAVFVLERALDQSTVVMAQPGGVRQEDSEEYFASRLANHILGAGGFGSRITARVRTEQGLAYSASSVWTDPRRHEGVVGAVASTRADRTLEATRLLLEVMDELRAEPPPNEEVEEALQEIVNGYVFAFGSPSQIVLRRMGHRALGLPGDWLERYLDGLREVTPEAIHSVVNRHLHPAEMTILLVGDPDRFDPGLEAFESVYRLSPDGSYEPW